MKTLFSKIGGYIIHGCLICLVCYGCVQKKPVEPVTEPHVNIQERPVPLDETAGQDTEALQDTTEKIPVSNDIVHYVQWEKETLSIIARWYTGALKNWKALEAANPEINPHILHINTSICIPEALIINRAPMPKEFIDQFYMNKKPDTPQNLDPEEEQQGDETEEDIQLFGPRPFQTE